MKVLVTGGGGFLGRAVVDLLLQRGVPVRSFSRGDYPGLRSQGVDVIRGDLADPGAVKHACSGCDIVYHVAAKAGLWGRYADFYRANVVGTKNIITACRENGVTRLIYTSSPSVIFNGRDMEGADEAVPYPHRYKAFYPATKADAERLVLEANDSRLLTVALRPHLIWGPGDTHLVPGILERARQGKIRRLGKDDKIVDFTYITNAAEAHLLAADNLHPNSRLAGRAYFITNGEPVPLWGFINQLLAAADLPPVSRSLPVGLAYLAGWLSETVWRALRLAGEPPMTRFLVEELATSHWFNIDAAHRDFGYQPRVSVQEGLRLLREWLRTSGQ
jgi:2-alkyl-3-oxoalkanoate reductase